MPGELQAVLWDMDGTLVDSEPTWIRSQQALVAQFGGIWTEADGLTLVGTGMPVTVEAMQRAGVTLEPARILETLELAVVSELRRQIVWRPGAAQLVRDLHLNGIPQAIVTTSPRRLTHLVSTALGEHGLISVLVTGDDVARPKPDPEGYLLAAQLLKVNVTNCIAIEDSATGLTAAESSGAHTIRITPDAGHRSNPRLTPWETLEHKTTNDLRELLR